MRKFLTALCCWLLAGPALGAATPLAEMGAGPQVLVTYQGPGDVVSGATAWYGLRAYNAAYATGTNKAINVRRASDNTTQDINILTTGALDIASANTFATQDATASCTSATTTVACTAASSTPHVGSTITGAGLTQPCYAISVGTFTAGAGSVTTNGCGTVSVAVSTTFQYGLYVTEFYDQTGNAWHQTQATAASQPQLLPLCVNSLPCAYGSGTKYLANVSIGNNNQPLTVSAVVERTGAFTTQGAILGGGNGAVFKNSANTVAQFYGSFPSATASDSALHAVQFVANNTSSLINVDNTQTAGASGSGNFPSTNNLGLMAEGNGTTPMTGYLTEAGFWLSAFSTGTQTSMCHNQFVYWATSTSC